MASSLKFYQDSFDVDINIVAGAQHLVQLVFTAKHIDNIGVYVAGLADNTEVAVFVLKGPSGGVIINGSLYYVANSNPLQFKSDVFLVNPPDSASTIVLNFGYRGATPYVSNNVFGSSQLTIVPTTPPIFTVNNSNGFTVSQPTLPSSVIHTSIEKLVSPPTQSHSDIHRGYTYWTTMNMRLATVPVQ